MPQGWIQGEGVPFSGTRKLQANISHMHINESIFSGYQSLGANYKTKLRVLRIIPKQV